MQNAKLLVVEDDASLRLALRKILEKAGYAVTVAGDAGEALGRLAERHYDLILTDYYMPGKSGLALAREVFKHITQCRPPVVVMTAFGDLVGALEAPGPKVVHQYVRKPIGRADLLGLIDDVLHQPRDRGRARDAHLS